MNYGAAVGQDFDPHYRVNSAKACVDVRAQRRGADGYRAAIYLPSRAGQVRVAIDIPPGTLRGLAEQYSQLMQYGEIAEVSGIDFFEALPEVDEGPEFVEGLEQLLGPALGLLGPLLGGGGGGGGLEGLLGGLLGGGGGGGGRGGGGGGGGLEQLLALLQSGGLGQGAQMRQRAGLGGPFDAPGGMGGVMGGLGNLGGAPPGAPGLGGLLGGILGGIPILGPLLGPLFGAMGGGGGPQKPNTVERGAPTTYVQAATQQTPYGQQQEQPQQRYAGPPVWGGPQTQGGGVGTQPTGFEGRVSGDDEEMGDDDEAGEGEQLEELAGEGDYLGEIPPLEGTALALGEALGSQALEALPFLTASHVLSEAVREVALNPHRYGPLTAELEGRMRQWLAAADAYAAAAIGHPGATEAIYRAKYSPEGNSALNVAKSLIRAPRF